MLIHPHHEYAKLLQLLNSLGLQGCNLHSILRWQGPSARQYDFCCDRSVQPIKFDQPQHDPVDPDKVVNLAYEAYRMGLDGYRYVACWLAPSGFDTELQAKFVDVYQA